MFETLFNDTNLSNATTAQDAFEFVVCMLVALALGLALALIYGYRGRHTWSLAMSLVTLPAIVAVVIMMVDGNVGTGVAVAGGFSLVRFRSVPGQARDIAYIFLAMALGLVCGMGYLALAAIVTVAIGGCNLVLQAVDFGHGTEDDHLSLRVTIPEDLDHTHAFDDLLERYTSQHELVSVKTTNMGSLYKLVYDVCLREPEQGRPLMDELRCRNGNLEVALAHREVAGNEM